MARWDVSLFGFGGQGIFRAGEIIGEAAALEENKDVALSIWYGPEQVGGWSRADLVISDEPIDFPLVTKPDILLTMSQEGLDRSWKEGRIPKVLLIYDSGLVDVSRVKNVKMKGLPATRIAEKLGRRIVANIVMLGAFSALTGIVSQEALLKVIKRRFPRAVELNEKAFRAGIEQVEEAVSNV